MPLHCLQGLWRGTVPGLLLTIPYTAVQFAALQEARASARKWGLMETHFAPAVSFVSGAVAGAAATVASYPFDLLRTTLAAQGEPKVKTMYINFISPFEHACKYWTGTFPQSSTF